MADKAPYRMTIKLSSSRPDALSEALATLRATCGEYDQSGEASATLTLENYKEAPLQAIYEVFELWLYRYKIGIECEVKLARPGVRPETVAALRATKTTPMDRNGWEQQVAEAADQLEQAIDEAAEAEQLPAEAHGPIIIAPPLALPPPRATPALAIAEGTYTFDDDQDENDADAEAAS
jgi:hypothetical protein